MAIVFPFEHHGNQTEKKCSELNRTELNRTEVGTYGQLQV